MQLLDFGVAYHVGASTVFGRTAVARVALGGAAAAKRRIAWTPQTYAAGVDAAMAPTGLDQPVVRFALRAPVASDRPAGTDRAAGVRVADTGSVAGLPEATNVCPPRRTRTRWSSPRNRSARRLPG